MIRPHEMEGRGWWLKWPSDLADEHFPQETTTGWRLIPSSEIRAELVPHWSGGWTKIYRFAWTFPAYEVFGLEKAGELANECQAIFTETGWLPSSLPLLRCGLFFEQRKAQHTGTEMDMPWTAVLLEAIRLVASGQAPTPKAIAAQGVPVPGRGYPGVDTCFECAANLVDIPGEYCPHCGSTRRWAPDMAPYA